MVRRHRGYFNYGKVDDRVRFPAAPSWGRLVLVVSPRRPGLTRRHLAPSSTDVLGAQILGYFALGAGGRGFESRLGVEDPR